MGRKVAKRVNGTITEKYLWQGAITLVAVYDGSDNLLQRFEYPDGRMPASMVFNGSMYYFTYDQIGSFRVITDAAGTVVKRVDYDTFGNILNDSNSSFTVPFGFAGGLHDRDTGLVRFGARDYDPATGKWTAKDPIDFGGRDLNLFNYTFSDPINWVDPFGLDVTINIYRGSYDAVNGITIPGTIFVESDDPCDGTFRGHTLELVANHTPKGSYDAFIREDHTPNRIELRDVQGHTDMQIHVGNTSEDTTGCPLAGTGSTNDPYSINKSHEVSDSTNAMNSILGIIENDASGNITVNIIMVEDYNEGE